MKPPMVVAIWLACCLLLVSPVQSDEKTNAPKAKCVSRLVELPHAGISLKLDGGMRMVLPRLRGEILRAVAQAPDSTGLVVTIAARCVGKNADAEGIANKALHRMQADTTLTNLKHIKTDKTAVAGISGIASVVDYSCGPWAKRGVYAYFVRKLQSADIWLCYEISVEVHAAQAARLLPIFGEIISSVKLTAPQHPTPVAGSEGVKVLVAGRKSPLRVIVPLGWHAKRLDGGVCVYASDLLRKGARLPQFNLYAAVGREVRIPATQKSIPDKSVVLAGTHQVLRNDGKKFAIGYTFACAANTPANVAATWRDNMLARVVVVPVKPVVTSKPATKPAGSK